MRFRFLAALLACVSLAGLTFGDVPPNPRPRPPVPAPPLPPEPKVPTYPLVIEVSPNVAEAKLVIPRKMLGDLRGELPADQANPITVAGRSRLHTVIAGAALALGLAFSGLWLVRRGRGSGKTFGIALGAVCLLGVGAAVWADLAPPRPRPGPVQAPMRSPRMNNVLIEVVEKGDAVKLIVSPDKLSQTMARMLNQQLPLNPAPQR